MGSKNFFLNTSRVLDIPAEAQSLADDKNFEIKMYGIGAAKEQTRPPRLVKVAVVQNAIVLPTTAPVKDQVEKTMSYDDDVI